MTASSAIILRRPVLEDVGALAELHVRCWHEAYSDIVPAEVLGKCDVVQHAVVWREFVADHQRIIYAVFSDKTPVGFIHCTVAKPDDPKTGYLRALYVRQSQWRLGLGRKLLGYAAQALAAAGLDKMELAVLTQNHAGRQFYERMGAKPVREEIFVWHNVPLDVVIYLFDPLETLLFESQQAK